MSKLLCTCGHVIPDSSDMMSNKAYFLADQDRNDFMEEIEKKDWHKQAEIAGKYLREIFQCSGCNNIIFLTEAGRFDFAPVDEDIAAGVLQSYLGQQWRGTISGNYTNDKGTLYWNTNRESEFLQDLTLEELRRIYFSKHAELKKLKILRSSFLRVNDVMEHEYELKR